MNRYGCLLIGLIAFFNGGNGQMVGNPDHTAVIERPCHTYDQQCISEFLHEHSSCTPVLGKSARTTRMYSPSITAYITFANITAVSYDFTAFSPNVRIDEFYINRASDMMVIAAIFRNLTASTNNMFFEFHRPRKEPVVTHGSAVVVFDSITITAVVPAIHRLQMNKAVITSYLNSPQISLDISPSVFRSDDPQVPAARMAIFTNVVTFIQEKLFTESSFYLLSYIEKSFCDFGLKP